MFPATAPDIARLVWGAGAVGAIMLSLSSINAERALLWRPLQWLGRVSYSLYLTHIIILLTLVHLLDGRVPLPLIVAAVMALSFLCAGLMFRYIEQPSMRAGRYFTEMGRLPKPGTT